jgi:hypothetical protein
MFHCLCKLLLLLAFEAVPPDGEEVKMLHDLRYL